MAKFTLQPGQWFMYSIDQPIPSRVNVYTGDVFHREKVATINRMQALALKRWHGYPGIYHSYRDGSGNYRDVRVVGEVTSMLGTGSSRIGVTDIHPIPAIGSQWGENEASTPFQVGNLPTLLNGMYSSYPAYGAISGLSSIERLSLIMG